MRRKKLERDRGVVDVSDNYKSRNKHREVAREQESKRDRAKDGSTEEIREGDEKIR